MRKDRADIILYLRIHWRQYQLYYPGRFRRSIFWSALVKVTTCSSPKGIQLYWAWNNLSSAKRQRPAILDYLWQSLSSIEWRFPNCGLLIVGDFSRLNTKRLQNSFDLKQIVTFPTRGDRTLDLVLTNLKEYYKDPIQRPSIPTVYQITCP